MKRVSDGIWSGSRAFDGNLWSDPRPFDGLKGLGTPGVSGPIAEGLAVGAAGVIGAVALTIVSAMLFSVGTKIIPINTKSV